LHHVEKGAVRIAERISHRNLKILLALYKGDLLNLEIADELVDDLRLWNLIRVQGKDQDP